MMLSWIRMVRNGQNQVELIGLLMDWIWIMQEKRESRKVLDKGRVNFQGRIKVAWGKGNWCILNATSVPCSPSEPLPTTASRYRITCRKEVRRPPVIWVLSTLPAWFPSILPVPTPTKAWPILPAWIWLFFMHASLPHILLPFAQAAASAWSSSLRSVNNMEPLP